MWESSGKWHCCLRKEGTLLKTTTLLVTRMPNGFNLTLVSNPQLIEIKMWLHKGFSPIVFACYSDQPWKKWLQIFQSLSLVNCGIFFSSVMWSWPTTNAVTNRWFKNDAKMINALHYGQIHYISQKKSGTMFFKARSQFCFLNFEKKNYSP